MVIISMILENNNDQIMTIMTSHYYNDQVATLPEISLKILPEISSEITVYTLK